MSPKSVDAAAARQSETVEKRDLLGPDVGKRIHAVRTRRGMSLARVGGNDMTRSFLSLVENGHSRISLRALAIVAERLETPIATFLQDEDEVHRAELSLDYAEIELERGQPVEAIRIIEEGADAYRKDPRAQWTLGRALVAVQDFKQSESVLRFAADLAESGSDHMLRAEIKYYLGWSLYETHRNEEALDANRQGLEVLQSGPANEALEARLLIAIGHSLLVLNRATEAIAHYERAQEILGAVYDLPKVGAIFSAMSLAARKMGDYQAALRYSRRSVATYRLIGDWRLVASELNNMAVRYRDLGDLKTAESRAEEAIARAQQVGAQDVEAIARATLASVFLQQGRVTDARGMAEAAERLSNRDVSPRALVDAWVVQARCATAEKDWEAADTWYSNAISLLTDLDYRSRIHETALEYAQVLRERGEFERAMDMAMTAAGAAGASPPAGTSSEQTPPGRATGRK